MVAMTIQNQVSARESIERKTWTSQDWHELLAFLAQSSGLVCAGVFLYSLGPALGMTLIVVSRAVWSFLRSQTASAEEEDGRHEDDWQVAGVNSASHGAGPVWMRSSRFGMSTAAVARPVQRQGA